MLPLEMVDLKMKEDVKSVLLLKKYIFFRIRILNTYNVTLRCSKWYGEVFDILEYVLQTLKGTQ